MQCKIESTGSLARRTAFGDWLTSKLNHTAGRYGIHVFWNCIFYISLMYEFLHSQGQKRTFTSSFDHLVDRASKTDCWRTIANN